MSERLEAALAFATEKHKGQKRIGGDDYITHPIAVSEIVREHGGDEDSCIAALFHDLLEDTDATEDEIRSLGGDAVLEAVKLLTKQDGYVMEEYVAGIKANPIAFMVKGADRLHNLRCALCTDTDFKRRYILESLDWYIGFMPEIKTAVKDLAKSLDSPMTELSFLYEPIDNWKI